MDLANAERISGLDTLLEALERPEWFHDHAADALTQHDKEALYEPLRLLLIDLVYLQRYRDRNTGIKKDRGAAMLAHRESRLGHLLYPLLRDYLARAAE